MPLDSLNVIVGIAIAGGETVGEDQRTERVASAISTVRVELSSAIVGIQTDALLVNEASDLDVGGGLEELDGGDGASRHNPAAMGVLGAVRNRCSLNVTD